MKTFAGLILLIGVMVTNSVLAETVRLNIQSSVPTSLVQLGTGGVRLVETINLISAGEVQARLYEPNALVPPLEIFDAVSTGAVDAGWSTPIYWGGRNSAMNIFGAVPFGPTADDYLAWMWYGGGEGLMNEIYNANGLHGLVCGILAPEAAGWFRKEINNLQDLNGLRMRFPGLGAKVMQKIGVDTQILAVGDIYLAMERGAIDATEFSMPAVDLSVGMQNVADHYYFPGWHQQATIVELLIHQKKWIGMSFRQQELVRTVCRASVATMLAEGEALQGAALSELAEVGVKINRLDQSILDALETAWGEVAKEESAANADFQTAWDSLQNFRAQNAEWKNLRYLD